MNIVDIAAGSDDFNLLVRALTAANLVTTIQDAEDITVFAPTDAAFRVLALNLGFEGDDTDEDAIFDAIVAALTDLGGGDPIPLLTDILLYHVSGSVLTDTEIAAQTSISTLLTDATILPANGALGDAEPDLADPIIVTPNIAADNGIIQAIDAVLLPIDIAGNEPSDGALSIGGIVVNGGSTAFNDPGEEFDILLAAVLAAGLTDALNAEDADLTVFAPTDAAFLGLAQTLGFAGSDEAAAFDFIVKALTLLSKGADPVPLLTDILTFHVSPGAKDAAAVLATDTISTLLGADIAREGTMLVDAEPDLANPSLVATDVMASNGIIHVIDGVLIPVDLPLSDGSDDVDFVISGDDSDDVDLGEGNDFIDAGDGDDTIEGGAGNDVILGGAGTDAAVFANDFASYGIEISGDSVTVQDKSGLDAGLTGTDTLGGIERLAFGDGASFASEGAINLEILKGAASLQPDQVASLVELYVAYFDRAPDALGVLFWGNALAGGVSLREIAELFFDQPEAQAKLPGDTETGAFVDLAYDHVLERDADASGRDFWVDALDSGAVSRGEFMLELIAGARANADASDDVRTIEDKADIGIAYALVRGLTDVGNAETVMAAYDRDDAEASLATAQTLIGDFTVLADGGADGPETTVQILGLIDDPFAVA